jgi:hypothetical protein
VLVAYDIGFAQALDVQCLDHALVDDVMSAHGLRRQG